MPAGSPHHKTRKRGYTLLLVPNDDVARPRNLKLSLWQLLLVVTGLIGVIVAMVFAALIYTPVGTWVNIPNPQLEIRYTQQLVVLNQRMASLMEQLVELRAYNVKLRNALGEEAVATDTGIVVKGKPRSGNGRRSQADPGRVGVTGYRSISGLSTYPLSLQQVAEPAPRTSFPAVFPTEGYVTRGFIPEQRHFGLDIAGKIGTPVNAAADGYVVFAGWTNDEGYVVILSHTDGFLTFYKHNQSLLKTANTFVRRGEPIALLGNSGRTSSGPHLHFEIWKNGAPVDPASYLLNINL